MDTRSATGLLGSVVLASFRSAFMWLKKKHLMAPEIIRSLVAAKIVP